MLAYPLDLHDDDGSVMVTSRDFPELTTSGEDRAEAIARATDALEERRSPPAWRAASMFHQLRWAMSTRRCPR